MGVARLFHCFLLGSSRLLGGQLRRCRTNGIYLRELRPPAQQLHAAPAALAARCGLGWPDFYECQRLADEIVQLLRGMLLVLELRRGIGRHLEGRLRILSQRRRLVRTAAVGSLCVCVSCVCLCLLLLAPASSGGLRCFCLHLRARLHRTGGHYHAPSLRVALCSTAHLASHTETLCIACVHAGVQCATERLCVPSSLLLSPLLLLLPAILVAAAAPGVLALPAAASQKRRPSNAERSAPCHC